MTTDHAPAALAAIDEWERELTSLGRRHIRSAKSTTGHVRKVLAEVAGVLGFELETLPLDRVTRRHLVNAVTLHSQHLAVASVESRVSALRSFFRWATDCEYVTESPAATIRPPRRSRPLPRPLTLDECNSIVAATKYSEAPERDRALLLFVMLTGCRLAEAAGMTLDRLTRDADGNLTGATVMGKGSKERWLPFPSAYVPVLEDWLEHRESYLERTGDVTNGLWVQKRRGQDSPMLTYVAMSKRFKRMMTLGGVTRKGVRVHALRHTFASESLRSRAYNPRELMEQLGHADLRTLQRYTQVGQEDLRKAVDAHPLVGLV